MLRSSSGGRRTMSWSECSRDDAIICSMLCRSTRGARARPARTGSSIARPRAARASELTDSVTVFVPSSMVPSTMAPSSIVAPKVWAAVDLRFAAFRGGAFASIQFQKPSLSFQREGRSSRAVRIAIGVLDLRQGGIERPSERVIQPQIAEHERRTGQNLLKAGHGRKVDLVDIPAERLGELPRLRARLFPDALNRSNGLFRQGVGERQHGARDLRLAENGDDPGGNPVPLRKTVGGGALEHPHRLSAAHEVARQEALADHDVADFVEAHYGGPQRPDVGPRPGALLPAPSLEIIVRDVPLAGARRHKILKSASPQHGHPIIADDIGELLERDARAATGGADMAVEHCFEVVPPLVALYPLDQPLNAIDGRHEMRLAFSSNGKSGIYMMMPAARSSQDRDPLENCDAAVLFRFA